MKFQEMENSSLHEDLDHDIDDLEMQVVRYKPEGLDVLCRNTKFSRKELQIMYRGFKQECPTGIVNEETFKEIYAQFFPQGDSSAYAHYVFNTFDHDHNGSVSFEEFVMGLSVLSRGSLQERLQWAFGLYDINGDGIITKEEMMDIVSAIYEMMGRFTEPMIDETTAREHVERVFQKMDQNRDGVISLEEFMDTCRRDENIKKGMAIFDTVSFDNWGPGQPDNHTDERCVVINKKDGKWNDIPCNKPQKFVCEIQALALDATEPSYCYISPARASWDDAEQSCISKGGYLAELESQEEHGFIEVLTSTSSISKYSLMTITATMRVRSDTDAAHIFADQKACNLCTDETKAAEVRSRAPEV
ncbi:hypothetical protein ScPMuIL_001526 [Solemya velum]